MNNHEDLEICPQCYGVLHLDEAQPDRVVWVCTQCEVCRLPSELEKLAPPPPDGDHLTLAERGIGYILCFCFGGLFGFVGSFFFFLFLMLIFGK